MMTTKISVPNKNEVDNKSQEIFKEIKDKLGMLPNLYATIGYSSNALSNYLSFSANAGKNVFTSSEIEAIKLAVSDVNNCHYCLAAHTALAQANGFTEREAFKLRKATISDPKLQILTSLAREIVINSGKVADEHKESFFHLGYNEGALIEFVSIVISASFTNYIHGLTEVEIDFRPVN